MFQIVRYENFKNEQIIFKEGTFGDWLYLVDEGEVEISRKVEGKKIVIAVFKSGDIFGEVAYITKAARSATASAIGDTTVGVIDRNFFDQEFNKLSGDFQSILKIMANRLKKTTDVLIAFEASRE
jgi:CRP-like cAMP-binding protein